MRNKTPTLHFPSSPVFHLSISPVLLFILSFAICIATAARAAENFFIVWGPVFHEDQTLCSHRPQDPHFALPNQVSYVAYFAEHPGTVVTERSPKWNIRDDAPLPGNGYYGIEVGNLHRAVPAHSDTLALTLTCEATGQQGTVIIPLRDFELGHQQFPVTLRRRDVPRRPSFLQVSRQESRNVLRWPGTPGLSYDLYRSDLTDTLNDGRALRVYHRLSGNVNDSTFVDTTIDTTRHYGYLVIPRTPGGISGAHSMEGVDIPLEEGPIARMALFSTGDVAVSRAGSPFVSILNRQGQTVTALKAPPRPTLAVDREDNLWIVGPPDTGSDSQQEWIHGTVYSPEGTLLNTFPLSRDGNVKGEMRDMTIDRRGRLWLLTGRGVYAFTPKLRLWIRRDFDAATFRRPTSLAIFRGHLAVTDPVAKTVNLFRLKHGTLVRTGVFSTGSLEPWDVQWIRSDKLAVSDPFKKTVSLYDPTGRVMGSINTDVAGPLESPRALQRRRHTLVVSDRNRILMVPVKMDGSRFSPRIAFGKRGKATLSWQSAIPTPTSVRTWPEGHEPKVTAGPRPTRHHRITLEDLPPVSRINFTVSSPLETIPPRVWSEPLDFATPLWKKGKTAVLRLPLAVIVHTHAVDLSEQPRNHPPTAPIPPGQVDLIRRQINEAVLFYWNNSSMKVFLDVDFFTGDRFLDVDPFGEYPPPDPQKIEPFLASRGHHLTDYVGIVRIIAEQRFDTELNAWVLAGRGGGFTWGINPTDSLPGASWWRATPAGEGSGNDWLMTHEFHHQLDAMFQESNHPEYPFNHFSPLEYSGPFGEHYDGNAYILREWGATDWFLLRWGDTLVVSDSDEDGIPDDDPRLPSDEMRLGSDPESPDSDGDGLHDMEEVLLSNWVTSGVGEDWGGPVHLPGLTNPDADGDGIPDGKDPYPLYDIDPAIPRVSPVIDGNIDAEEWPSFYHLEDTRGQGEFALAWDDHFLYGAARIRPPGPFHLQIDAAADGWFSGRDNLVFRFTPNNDEETPTVETSVFVCDEQPDRYPYMNTDLISADSVRAANRFTGEEWVLEYALPRMPRLGLTLEPGREIGINAGCYFDSSLRRRVSLFEPHKLIRLTLSR